jgi:hypothetical protein
LQFPDLARLHPFLYGAKLWRNKMTEKYRNKNKNFVDKQVPPMYN